MGSVGLTERAGGGSRSSTVAYAMSALEADTVEDWPIPRGICSPIGPGIRCCLCRWPPCLLENGWSLRNFGKCCRSPDPRTLERHEPAAWAQAHGRSSEKKPSVQTTSACAHSSCYSSNPGTRPRSHRANPSHALTIGILQPTRGSILDGGSAM